MISRVRLDGMLCSCGEQADRLCDFPVGRGLACDLVLCEGCARDAAGGHHLCGDHFAEFSARAEQGTRPVLVT